MVPACATFDPIGDLAHDTRPDHRVIVRVRPKKPLALAMNDMAADLSNGASGSTLHVGTLKYTTGLRPVQKVNSGFLSLTTRAAGVVEAAHGFRHEESNSGKTMRMQPNLRCERGRYTCSFFVPTIWEAAFRLLNSILMMRPLDARAC